MAPIIRISDEAFTRLQKLAEPFIDTPSSVVEKLLDFYEATSIPTQTHGPRLAERRPHINQNLFLVPATPENIERTISASVSMQEISSFLSPNDKKNISEKSQTPNTLHCWATTKSSRAEFDAMGEGDIVLITPKNTGKFQYYGEVFYKTENEALGSYLWKVTPGRPWRLIYFLRNVKEMDIDKPAIVSELGFKKNFPVMGIIRVNELKVRTILERYSSIKEFIESMSK